MHAEYFVVPAMVCHSLPDGLSWEAGVLLSGDGFGVPYHSNTKMAWQDVKTVAIFGMGAIGLGNLLLQHYLGRTVFAIDFSETRLALAKEWGAAAVINPGAVPDVPAAVKALTEGKGADVCIEAAGKPETAKNCFKAVKTNGLVVFNGEQKSVDLSPSDDFIRRDITAAGAWYYHHNEFPSMLALYQQGLPVTRLGTHAFPFERASEAYRIMSAGESGKVFLHYS
jgi:threonine dehydrogenase-like Zn-dependent dehydrogenase